MNSESVPGRKIRLLLEYDGSAYVGWQRQTNGPSIEGALEDALATLEGTRVPLRVAGRTDAGVHATGQVVSFWLRRQIPSERLASALNSLLPRDITVHLAETVAPTFDARDDATSKRYRYRIYQARQPSALERRRAWYRRAPLDVEAMREAARHLVGHLDFEAFRSAHCDAPHARRMVYGIAIHEAPRPPRGRVIELDFHANAFCRHMVRILTGTLVEVGQGRRTPEDVRRILESRDRREAGVTAPPHGLTLIEVRYDPAERRDWTSTPTP